MSTNNQFLDFMKSFMDQEFYMNSVKNIPTMDFSSFGEIMKKSTKIATTTNQIATESLQSMINKNSEIFQNNTANMLDSAKDAMASGDLKQMADCQQKCIKSAYEASINHAKELVNIASESSIKIFDIINKDIAEQMNKNCGTKVKA